MSSTSIPPHHIIDFRWQFACGLYSTKKLTSTFHSRLYNYLDASHQQKSTSNTIRDVRDVHPGQTYAGLFAKPTRNLIDEIETEIEIENRAELTGLNMIGTGRLDCEMVEIR